MPHPYDLGRRKDAGRKTEVRNPNTGPYVVSWMHNSNVSEQECQTWIDASHLMRHLLVSGFKDVSVRFV